jgi:hypothetical protein
MKGRHVRAFNIPPLGTLTDAEIDEIAGPLADAIAASMAEVTPEFGPGGQATRPRLVIESEGALLGPTGPASKSRLVVESEGSLLGPREPDREA